MEQLHVGDMNTAEQLNEIHQREEFWLNYKMPVEESLLYHSAMYDRGNIVTAERDGKVVGYFEVWKINFEQFGRLFCRVPFSGFQEDVQSGNIAYVANVWIAKDYRNGSVVRELKKKFFEATWMCDYFVGQALRKTASQPVKVFKKEDLVSSFYKQGV